MDRVSVSVITKQQKILEVKASSSGLLALIGFSKRYNFEISSKQDVSSEMSIDQIFDQMKAFILRIQSFNRPAPPSGM